MIKLQFIMYTAPVPSFLGRGLKGAFRDGTVASLMTDGFLVRIS